MSTVKAPKNRSRKERNPEETRRRILGCAETEFAKKGYDGARLRDVAAAAEVHHALLHHYFGDKAGLFAAVVERAFDHTNVRAREALAGEGEVRPLMDTYVGMLVDFHAENPNLARILHFASLDPGSPAYAACADITRRIGAPLLEAVASALEAAQAEGQVRNDISARRLVALAIGAVSYVFHEDRLFSGYLGGDVRSSESLDAHRAAAVAFVGAALFEGVPGGA